MSETTLTNKTEVYKEMEVLQAADSVAGQL